MTNSLLVFQYLITASSEWQQGPIVTLGLARSVHLSCRSGKVRNIERKSSQASTLPGGALLLSAAHNHRRARHRGGGGGGGGARGDGGGGRGGGGGGGECCWVGEVIQHVGHLVLWLLELVAGRGICVGVGGVGGGGGGVPGGVGGFRRIALVDRVVVGEGVGWLILGVAGVGGGVDGLAGGVGDRWLGVGVG